MASRRGDHGHFSLWPVIWTGLSLLPVFTFWHLAALHLVASKSKWAQNLGKAMAFQI